MFALRLTLCFGAIFGCSAHVCVSVCGANTRAPAESVSTKRCVRGCAPPTRRRRRASGTETAPPSESSRIEKLSAEILIIIHFGIALCSCVEVAFVPIPLSSSSSSLGSFIVNIVALCIPSALCLPPSVRGEKSFIFISLRFFRRSLSLRIRQPERSLASVPAALAVAFPQTRRTADSAKTHCFTLRLTMKIKPSPKFESSSKSRLQAIYCAFSIRLT